jgi:hypothetical protein
MNKKLINILSISFVALFITQVGHEAAHGIIANLVGAKWTQFNLFFVDHQWPGKMDLAGEILIKGSAAILNIIVGLLAVYLFNRKPSASSWTRRLFLFYLAAYNTFTGFGSQRILATGNRSWICSAGAGMCACRFLSLGPPVRCGCSSGSDAMLMHS